MFPGHRILYTRNSIIHRVSIARACEEFYGKDDCFRDVRELNSDRSHSRKKYENSTVVAPTQLYHANGVFLK